MFSVILFGVLFVVVYLAYYFIFDDMLKKEKYTKISELTFLVEKFKLEKKRENYRKYLNGVSVINAFIIALVSAIVIALPINIMFVLGVAFIMLIVLILVCYSLYGKYLHKKWGKK